jgi:hypothetical protein
MLLETVKGLSAGRGRAIRRIMTPLEKCMQTLSTLVRLNDPGGAELMEAAVASLLKPPVQTARLGSRRWMP